MGSRGSARLLAAVLAMTERSMEMPNDASLASPIDSPITSSASTWGIGVSLGASTLSSCGRTVGNASTSHKMCCSCSRSWSSTSSPSISALLAASTDIGQTGTRLLAATISCNGTVVSRSQGRTAEVSDPPNWHVTAATVTRSSGESEPPPWSAPGRVAPAAPGSAVILRSEWASVSHAGSADSASGGPWANISSGGP